MRASSSRRLFTLLLGALIACAPAASAWSHGEAHEHAAGDHGHEVMSGSSAVSLVHIEAPEAAGHGHPPDAVLTDRSGSTGEAPLRVVESASAVVASGVERVRHTPPAIERWRDRPPVGDGIARPEHERAPPIS